MSRLIRGEGTLPSPIMIVGERPGHDEAIERRPFVGPAGKELWYRLWRICDLTRDDVYVTNLVKTYSRLPPTPAEVRDHTRLLKSELVRARPSLIITVGYHAARFFLPQFADVVGDYFHGLAFRTTYGALDVRQAIVVPVVHSSAALRVPSRYQHQLTNDLRVVRAVLEGRQRAHTARRVAPYRVGLAGLRDRALGIDSEYHTTTGELQCVSLSAESNEAAIVEIEKNKQYDVLRDTIFSARRVISHHAPAEYHSLRRIGVDLTQIRVDDTMLKAYLLDLPQSLKVLAYRELGWQLDEHDDLVLPIDEARVRSTLEDHYATYVRLHRSHAQALKRIAARHRDAGKRAAEAKALALARLGKAPSTAQGEEIPRRALTSIARIIGHDASEADRRSDRESEESEDETPARDRLRARWQKSVFAPLVALPPEASWRDLPHASRVAYALTDAIAHRTLDDVLTARIVERGLRRAYEIDRAVLPFLVRNEEIGLAVDEAHLRSLSKQFKRELAEQYDVINDLAGRSVNPHSAPQVSDVLFTELGITPTKQTKSGKHYVTADKYLKARKHQHEIIPRILTARQLKKYIGTYTDKLPSLLREGRYHPEWKYTRTATGRLAEEIILLIPKHDPLARQEGRINRALAIRDAFYAVDGHTLVSVDLSQIELRCMAHLSQDRRLLRAYDRGEDIHANVAHELLGAPKRKEDQDESAHRLPAKTINFGVINGMTEFGMLDQLHENGQLQWTIDDVREMLEGWWKIHSGVDHYWKLQVAKAKRLSYVTDLFGARRAIGGIYSQDEMILREAERQCLCPIQMTADRISKIWNKRIWHRVIVPYTREKRYCEPWIRVHDDTTVECDEAIASTVAEQMLALVPSLLSIPTLAEAKTGQRWGSLR